MKKILLIAISFCFMNCSSKIGENIEGKWYLISKHSFIEFNISKDSLKTEKLSFNLKREKNTKRGIKIVEKIFLEDRILLIGEKESEKYYNLMTLVRPTEKNYVKYVYNEIDSITTIKTLKKINQNDNRKLLGYKLYSKEYLETFEKMKSIENMTLKDFKKYLEKNHKNNKKEDFKEFYEIYLKYATTKRNEYKNNLIGYYGGVPNFNFQINLQTLLELGYNPINNSDTMNLVYSKFMKNEEIIELMKTLKEK